MNARMIQRAIMVDSYSKQCLAIPNYTPKDWWECDVLEITKAGFTQEFEIKLSAADFRADRYKADRSWKLVNGEYKTEERKKHDFLSRADGACPNRFWFVSPVGILQSVQIPDWAGFMEAHPREGQFGCFTAIVKQAPRLHKNKVKEGIRNHIMKSYYHRFQWWFLHRQNQKEAV